MHRKWARCWIVLTAAVLALPVPAAAGEWASWRGPDQNGTSGETRLVSDWSPQGKNLLWHAEFIGRSTPIVLDGQACVIGRVGEGIHRQEVVSCFDARSGALRWEDRFNVYNTTVPFNRVGWASLAGDPETGYIYAHGVAGQLIAYDRDGKVQWSYFLAEDVGRLSGYGGRTQTPLIDGDQLILTFVSSGWGDQAAPRHRYFAFDKRNGDIRWISTPGGMPADMNTQSAPVVAEIGGRRLLIAGNADGHIYAVDVGTGEKIWGYELSQRGINATVLVDGNRIYASHSEENVDDSVMGRLVAFDGSGRGDLKGRAELWSINELTAGFPSPALHDGRLYVVDNSANLHSIDAATGQVHWTHSIGTVGKASPVVADGKIYVPETNGRFHILEPGPDGVRPLSSVEIELPDGHYAEIYGSPAIAYGRVYLSTEAGLFCIGDPQREFELPARTRQRRPAKLKAFRGQPASVQVVPAEFVIEPGQTVQFQVRGFDAEGRLLGRVRADLALEGIQGTLGKNGSFRADSGQGARAGHVVARVGDVEGRARGRVIPPPPWHETFDGYDLDSVPPHWIGARGKFAVQEREGERVLAKLFRPRGLLRNATYLGPSSMRGYTIEADLMGGQVKRRRSDLGLINSGYTMDLMGNHQRIQVRSWTSEERMAQQVDFPWEMGVWYRMKLRVDAGEDKALIRGKVWKRDEAEPADWTIVVEDPHPIAAGAPGLLGYSPVDIYYDNIKVTVNP